MTESTLAAWIEEELKRDAARATSREVLDICADAKTVNGEEWSEISSILKEHDALGAILEALHQRSKRGETAKWVDSEIRKDKSVATNKEIVDIAWDAMTGDGQEWNEITDVLKEHGVFDAVLEVVQRDHTGEIPDNPPPPTDDDKQKNDPYRPGGPMDPEDDLNFRISGIKKIDMSTPVYYVEIDGSMTLRLVGADALMKPHVFKRQFFATFNKVPKMPAKAWQWEDLLNRYMLKVEEGGLLVVEEQPDESSEEGLVRHALRELLDELAVGETVEDLDHGRVLSYKDGFLVKQGMLLKAIKVRTGITSIKTDQVGEQLRQEEIGAVFKRGLRIDGRQVRVWFFKRESREKGEGGEVLYL